MFQVSEENSLKTKKIIINSYSTLVSESCSNLLYGYTIKKEGSVAKRLHNYIIGYQENGTFIFLPINIHGDLEGEIIRISNEQLKKIKISKQWNCEFFSQNFYLEITIPPYSPDINTNVGLMAIDQKEQVNQFYRFVKNFQ